MNTIPRIALSSPSAPAALDAAASAYGFFQIADHGVPDQVIEQMRTSTARFFSRPLEDKLPWCAPSPDINRGYAAKGTEGLSYSLGQASVPDLFEAFNIGPDDVDTTGHWATTPFFAPNIWPANADDLRTALIDYFTHVAALARRLLALFAESLAMPVDFFVPYTTHSTDTLRINHYQRGPAEGDPLPGQLGMGPHTDYGIVTVLYGDPVPGLQILLDGTWVDVQPEPGCFLVNLGDLLAQWTNDRWRSTLHRVLPPQPGQQRRSAAFFHDGNYDALVSCLPTCTSNDKPVKYAPVTAGEHLMAKLLGPRTLQASAHTLDTSADRR
jgi:isopenicillin N synthase-like dioxygenase